MPKRKPLSERVKWKKHAYHRGETCCLGGITVEVYLQYAGGGKEQHQWFALISEKCIWSGSLPKQKTIDAAKAAALKEVQRLVLAAAHEWRD